MLALLPLVLSLAPEIARWISGSKAETVTQKAVEVVQAITGTTDPKEAARIVEYDASKSLELKLALAKIASEQQAIEANERIETLRAEISDTANARNQTIKLAETHSGIAWAPVVLSVIIVVGFFLAPIMSKYIGYSIDQIWMGALIAMFANVGNYWLGQSASGKRAQEAVQSVAQRSADTVNSQAVEASRNRRATDPAPVVVVPPPPVVAPVPVSRETLDLGPHAVPPKPASSAEWRQGPFGGARWQVTPDGVLVEGDAAIARSVGEPVTVRKVWANYGPAIAEICGRLGVPVEVVVAVICTESKGIANAVYVEPDGRASGGLMQVLNTTASDILKRTVTAEDLKDPILNMNTGITYIYMNKEKTNYFDPILTAAAYNAGGIYPPRSQDNNRFHLRTTGDHLERMIRWYGDACYASKVDGWFKG